MEEKNNTMFSIHYGMFIPLAFMIASLVTSCFSYTSAKQNIASDLNDAMLALTNENSEIWTRQDTIAALRKMYETTHKPIIYQASDVNFKNPTLKDEAYFTLALVDKKNAAPELQENKILAWQAACRFASDSIMLMPEHPAFWFVPFGGREIIL